MSLEAAKFEGWDGGCGLDASYRAVGGGWGLPGVLRLVLGTRPRGRQRGAAWKLVIRAVLVIGIIGTTVTVLWGGGRAGYQVEPADPVLARLHVLEKDLGDLSDLGAGEEEKGSIEGRMEASELNSAPQPFVVAWG